MASLIKVHFIIGSEFSFLIIPSKMIKRTPLWSLKKGEDSKKMLLLLLQITQLDISKIDGTYPGLKSRAGN